MKVAEVMHGPAEWVDVAERMARLDIGAVPVVALTGDLARAVADHHG